MQNPSARPAFQTSAPDRVRVAHLHANTAWGGGETQLLALARRLQARGYFNVLVTPLQGELGVRARQAGLRVLPLERDGRRLRRCLREQLGEFGLTLLHAHDSGSTALGQALRRPLRLPLVLTRRIASPLRRNPRSRRKYAPARLDAVIAISETVREAMVRSGYPAGRIHVAPSGVDTAALSAMPVEPEVRSAFGGQYLVGGIGKLSPKKNWMLMVRAAVLLARDGLPVHWVLVGDGPERSSIEKALAAAGLRDRFHLTGFRADALRLLRQFDLLCFPSRMEGASVTVREAMAMGIPTVAADAPGVIESLAGTGWSVAADDPGALAATVRAVLSNPALRRERGAAAQRYACQQYDYERMVDETLAVYAQLAWCPVHRASGTPASNDTVFM